MTEQAIKEFWNTQAKEHGTSDTATAPDSAYRELEIKSIIPHIIGLRILDAGCGNGYSTFKFEQEYPDKMFTGIDYSERMILSACAEAIHRHSDILFTREDVRNMNPMFNNRFDTIISTRCLINLQTWDEQKQALLEMKKCLAFEGHIILVENFSDGLDNLNKLRKEFGLNSIETRWHNRYFDKNEFIEFVIDNFSVEYSENIGNEYYIISRVVYPALAKETGQDVSYDNPINYIAAKLPSLGHYNYSPNMLYILRAK